MSVTSAENQVSSYWNWYKVNGIFFDEFANSAGSESYYSTLNTYTKGLGMTYTLGNPGTSTSSTYYGIMNNLMIYESVGNPTLSYLASYAAPKSQWSLIAYGTSSLNTSFEQSAANYVAWEFITDAGGANPYNTLPTYFSSEVAALDTSGTTSATSTPTTTSTISSTTTASGTAASLSISTVNTANQPMTGFYIQSVVDNTFGTTIASGLFTPQTVSGVIGHSYSVTVDDYGGNYVVGASVGAFARTSANGGGGTATFTLQGNTIVAFTLSTTATLSISTVNASNQPLSGFYIQTIRDNTAGASVGNTYTPYTFTGTIGHSYSVTVDDYGSYYVQSANIETFTRNSAAQSGTTTFTLQGNTNLVFTMATKATLSISTVDTNNKPLNGFYIESVVDKTTGTLVASALYTPQTLTVIVGHTYSVTVDDYGTYHVLSANVGTFTRNSVDQSGTTTFTVQGSTNLVFTLG